MGRKNEINPGNRGSTLFTTPEVIGRNTIKKCLGCLTGKRDIRRGAILSQKEAKLSIVNSVQKEDIDGKRGKCPSTLNLGRLTHCKVKSLRGGEGME